MHCTIACGGTGGHLAPGIALAQAMQARGHTCQLVVSKKQIDARLLQPYPHLSVVQTSGSPLSANPWGLLKFCVTQTRAIWQNWRRFKKHRPHVVVGFGGFATLGAAAAGALLGIPLVLHEANRKPGRAFRLLSNLAARVYVPHGIKLRGALPGQTRHMGYPLRAEVKRMPQKKARAKFGLPANGPLILLMGGSQGAKVLNDWVVEHFPTLAQAGIHVCCVTGMGKGAPTNVHHTLKNADIAKAHFMPFCDDMAALLSAATLTIMRAGAGGIAEATHCTLPSILVPYPYAADGHQLANANFLERQGGTLVVQQKNIAAELLPSALSLIKNPALLQRMQSNLKKLRTPQCAQNMALDIEGLVASAATHK